MSGPLYSTPEDYHSSSGEETLYDSDSDDADSLPTQPSDSILDEKPSGLVSGMYKIIRRFCYDANRPKPDIESFMSVNNPTGPLGIFMDNTCNLEHKHAEEDRCERCVDTVDTFASLFRMIFSQVVTDDKILWNGTDTATVRARDVVEWLIDDRVADPRLLGCRAVSTIKFDEVVQIASRVYSRLDEKRFEVLNKFVIRLWNKSYHTPERQRIVSSLEPLNEALRVFFYNGRNSEPHDSSWSVINWWLRPPGTPGVVDLFEPMESMPWESCLIKLIELEGKLHDSNHVLDMEKANMVQISLLGEEIRRLVEEKNRLLLELLRLRKEQEEWIEDHNAKLVQVLEQVRQLRQCIQQSTDTAIYE